MSDDLVKRLQANGDVLRHIEAQAAEITRLRAALATARREGMEEAHRKALRLMSKYEAIAYQHGSLPIDPHECAAQVTREIAAMILAELAAAKERKS